LADEGNLIGKKLFKEFVNPETDRVLLHAGTTLNANNIKLIREAGWLDELAKCIDSRMRFMDLDGFEIDIPELPDIMKMFNIREPDAPTPQTKRRALVVDDAPFMRSLLIKLLLPGGFECHEAGTGREAIGLYAQIKPDVVTLDIAMPDIDGFATLQALRKLDPDAKVVMCTSSGHMDTVQNAIIHGAAGYLKKPISADALMNTMRDIGLPFPVAAAEQA
jgi:two-component system chemotaxis response regulator CheY